jgi:hypothetical protein
MHVAQSLIVRRLLVHLSFRRREKLLFRPVHKLRLKSLLHFLLALVLMFRNTSTRSNLPRRLLLAVAAERPQPHVLLTSQFPSVLVLVHFLLHLMLHVLRQHTLSHLLRALVKRSTT